MDPHCTHTELAAKRHRYGEQLAASGFSAAGRDIPMARLIAISDNAQRAEAIARRGAGWMLGAYMGPQHRGDHGTPAAPAEVDPVERYVNEVIIHGTTDSVFEQIEELKERAQMNYLMCAPLSQDSFTLLTDEVLPALA
jgi:alkanesulfonate monooxygenase SsuD/methylene tetrahydromethanopterin reductase-like flavin-dependent oxidoreductase (luciferase family)